jgi:hypothetical protein
MDDAAGKMRRDDKADSREATPKECSFGQGSF